MSRSSFDDFNTDAMVQAKFKYSSFDGNFVQLNSEQKDLAVDVAPNKLDNAPGVTEIDMGQKYDSLRMTPRFANSLKDTLVSHASCDTDVTIEF